MPGKGDFAIMVVACAKGACFKIQKYVFLAAPPNSSASKYEQIKISFEWQKGLCQMVWAGIINKI